MAKGPICGMVVPTATALSAQRAGRTFYFCSQRCRQTFLAPEQQQRRRIGIALGGVLALAILRAASYLALATGSEPRGCSASGSGRLQEQDHDEYSLSFRTTAAGSGGCGPGSGRFISNHAPTWRARI
ncbi:MAG: YHS domain-containing protein [Cyanobium sp.]